MTLAPEGTHQSIETPLLGMAQDGLAAFKPRRLSLLLRGIRTSCSHCDSEPLFRANSMTKTNVEYGMLGDPRVGTYAVNRASHHH